MKSTGLIKFEDHLKEQLKDTEFKKAYDDLEEEYALVEEIIRKRIEKEMTQEELARKMGTKQSAIARLESGHYNPSFKFLQRVAKAMDCKVKITFI